MTKYNKGNSCQVNLTTDENRIVRTVMGVLNLKNKDETIRHIINTVDLTKDYRQFIKSKVKNK